MLDVLNVITTLSIGLFAGALLTEGCILVPYWRKMKASEFFRLHGELGPALFLYFAPLTVFAVFMSVVSAFVELSRNGTDIWHGISAGLCLAALLIFFLYFKKANGKFADHAIADTELAAELARWARWHWLRTALVVASFACAIVATTA